MTSNPNRLGTAFRRLCRVVGFAPDHYFYYFTMSPSVDAASDPVPLSFPAILRHAGLSDRYAHLRPTKEMPRDGGLAKVSLKKGREERQ